MAKYGYKARDKFGKQVEGRMVADSEDAVAARLKETGFIPISVEIAKEEVGLRALFARFKGVKLSELNVFTRQFATLQRAGVSILKSISTLRDQTSNKILQDALETVANEIKEGCSLSGALEKCEHAFGPLYAHMIQTGEESGTLADVLERLAALGEHEQRVRTQIKAATRYPIMVVVAIMVAFLILTLFVVPRFAKIYSAANITLPLPTMFLIWTHQALTKFWWAALVIVAGSVFAFRWFINTDKGRTWWDGLKLKVPVFGPLMIKAAMSRFARVTSILMHSGVPILRILELTSQSVGNVIISRQINNIKTGVIEGKGIVQPMKESSFFPPVVIQMVAVGEESGNVDDLLLHVANYYDSEVEYTIENLTSLIEPILLLILGCAVLLMALGIFLPMWNLMALFKQGA